MLENLASGVKGQEPARGKPGLMELYCKAGPGGKSVGDCPFTQYVQIFALHMFRTLVFKEKELVAIRLCLYFISFRQYDARCFRTSKDGKNIE